MNLTDRVARYAHAMAKHTKWRERMQAHCDEVLADFLMRVIQYVPAGWTVAADTPLSAIADEGSEGYWGFVKFKNEDETLSISFFLGPKHLQCSLRKKDDRDYRPKYEFENGWQAVTSARAYFEGKEIDSKFLIREE